ncbi:MAG: hypothetical protein KDB60_13910 [Propionibacteriaceae bacterium]|nr:hypothetical protein [Propionibacteriaceae bacterium]
MAAVATNARKRWDAAGIAKYLRALVDKDMALADAEAQAVRAASDPGADTPAAIIFAKYQATHFDGPKPDEPECRECGKTRANHDKNWGRGGDYHDWEPVGGQPASTGESPNPQEEQVGEVPSAPPPADLPAQPATDTQPKTPDPAEGQQKPPGVSEGAWAAASAGEARGASHRTPARHEAA